MPPIYMLAAIKLLCKLVMLLTDKSEALNEVAHIKLSPIYVLEALIIGITVKVEHFPISPANYFDFNFY